MCASCAPPFRTPCNPSSECCPQGPGCNMTACQIDCMSQCCPPSPPATPRSVTVQQPPRLVVQRKLVYVQKVVQDPKLICRVKPVTLPHVTEVMKIRQKPVLNWITQVVTEPQVTWCKGYRSDPYVVCSPKIVSSPKEMCQTLICQPKPQTIFVPPPQEFCCYATGPQTLRCSNFGPSQCPPMPPCLPSSSQPIDPCGAPTRFGACSPYGPFGTCGSSPSLQCGPCDPSDPCLPVQPGCAS